MSNDVRSSRKVCNQLHYESQKIVWQIYLLRFTLNDILQNVLINTCNFVFLFHRYFCRSVEFDDQTKQCILSEEDSISQKDDISVSSSPTHHFYDLVCLDNRKLLFDSCVRHIVLFTSFNVTVSISRSFLFFFLSNHSIRFNHQMCVNFLMSFPLNFHLFSLHSFVWIVSFFVNFHFFSS